MDSVGTPGSTHRDVGLSWSRFLTCSSRVMNPLGLNSRPPAILDHAKQSNHTKSPRFLHRCSSAQKFLSHERTTREQVRNPLHGPPLHPPSSIVEKPGG